MENKIYKDYLEQRINARELEKLAHKYAFKQGGEDYWNKYLEEKQRLKDEYGVVLKDTKWED